MDHHLRATLLFQKTLGCLIGGLIGDALGTPTEGMDYRQIEAQFGWVEDFDCDTLSILLLESFIHRSYPPLSQKTSDPVLSYE